MSKNIEMEAQQEYVRGCWRVQELKAKLEEMPQKGHGRKKDMEELELLEQQQDSLYFLMMDLAKLKLKLLGSLSPFFQFEPPQNQKPLSPLQRFELEVKRANVTAVIGSIVAKRAKK